METILFPGLAPTSFQDTQKYIERSEFAKKRFTQASDVIGYSLIEAFKESKEEDYEIRESAYLALCVSLLDHFYDHFTISPDNIVAPSFGGLVATVQTEALSFKEALWLTHESAKIAKDFYYSLSHNYQTIFIYNLSKEDGYSYIKDFNKKGMYLELVGYLNKVFCFCGPEESIREIKKKINSKRKVFSLHTMPQPIHSRILMPLKKILAAQVFNKMNFKQLKVPIISDVDGSIIRNPKDFKQLILDGYDHTVRWDLVTEQLKNLSVQTVYVIGPRNIFTQLIKKQIKTIDINPDRIINLIEDSRNVKQNI